MTSFQLSQLDIAPMDNSKFSYETLELDDATNLRVYSCTAKENAKAVVHINHGMCEHAARYEQFMCFLAANGYHAIAQDHRGHGYTQADSAPQGTFAKRDGWKTILSDAKSVNTLAHERFNVPVIVFGHSMGAALALDYVLTHPSTVSAAAIWNGAMSGFLPRVMANLLKVERALKGSDCASALGPTLTFETWNKEFKPNRTNADWLSRDQAEVDRYVADPLCGFNASIGMWIDILNGLDGTAQASRYKNISNNIPFHIINGSKDPCSNKGGSADQLEKRLKAQNFQDVTKSILSDARHESLNEINKADTMQGFVAWLDDRFA